ncbi:MAG: hypothetical protein KGD63_13885 [Candidatus Lokiarchaeota archaeon]|nr:hypothetical protein [Candidatus Lokiarchaeota archaeon]
MVKILHDFWIITKNGLVLFNRVYDPKIETQLFGALLSAINTFAEEVSEGSLSHFQLSNKQFVLLKKNDILFIGNSHNKVKKEKIIDELEVISEKFFEDYFHIIVNQKWNGNIALFSDFKKKIEDAFEDPIKKFWKGF